MAAFNVNVKNKRLNKKNHCKPQNFRCAIRKSEYAVSLRVDSPNQYNQTSGTSFNVVQRQANGLHVIYVQTRLR